MDTWSNIEGGGGKPIVLIHFKTTFVQQAIDHITPIHKNCLDIVVNDTTGLKKEGEQSKLCHRTISGERHKQMTFFLSDDINKLIKRRMRDQID